MESSHAAYRPEVLCWSAADCVLKSSLTAWAVFENHHDSVVRFGVHFGVLWWACRVKDGRASLSQKLQATLPSRTSVLRRHTIRAELGCILFCLFCNSLSWQTPPDFFLPPHFFFFSFLIGRLCVWHRGLLRWEEEERREMTHGCLFTDCEGQGCGAGLTATG